MLTLLLPPVSSEVKMERDYYQKIIGSWKYITRSDLRGYLLNR